MPREQPEERIEAIQSVIEEKQKVVESRARRSGARQLVQKNIQRKDETKSHLPLYIKDNRC